jgi:hypothetical protein
LNLDAQPSAAVTLVASSSDTNEGAITNSATFQWHSHNWDTTATLQVQGQDDSLVDGDVSYSVDFVMSSADANFHGVAVTSVSITNTDGKVVHHGQSCACVLRMCRALADMSRLVCYLFCACYR